MLLIFLVLTAVAAKPRLLCSEINPPRICSVTPFPKQPINDLQVTSTCETCFHHFSQTSQTNGRTDVPIPLPSLISPDNIDNVFCTIAGIRVGSGSTQYGCDVTIERSTVTAHLIIHENTSCKLQCWFYDGQQSQYPVPQDHMTGYAFSGPTVNTKRAIQKRVYVSPATTTTTKTNWQSFCGITKVASTQESVLGSLPSAAATGCQATCDAYQWYLSAMTFPTVSTTCSQCHVQCFRKAFFWDQNHDNGIATSPMYSRTFNEGVVPLPALCTLTGVVVIAQSEHTGTVPWSGCEIREKLLIINGTDIKCALNCACPVGECHLGQVCSAPEMPIMKTLGNNGIQSSSHGSSYCGFSCLFVLFVLVVACLFIRRR